MSQIVRRVTAGKSIMPKLSVHDAKGKKVGTYNIEPTDLAPAINKQLLHDAVVMYQANQRQGTHQTKSRGRVAGSNKKLYRQKGTGNARAGHRRSGIRRGGGHIHNVRPRDYSYSLPRKALQLATRMAVAAKLRDDEITLIDKLSFESPKTRDMAHLVRALGCSDGTVLVTTESHDVNVYKSARNIARVSVSPAGDLNALSVLSAKRLLATPAALDVLKLRAAGAGRDAEQAAV